MPQFSERQIRKYHLMFKNIKGDTLEIIRRYIHDGIWRVEPREAYIRLGKMGNEIADVYDISHTHGPLHSSYEWYRPATRTIGLNYPKVSLISYLHEFRHHMQYAVPEGRGQHYRDKEVDARAWSISAYYLARPDLFKSAWKRGLIWYLPPFEEEDEEYVI